jgi:hypothetical protein
MLRAFPRPHPFAVSAKFGDRQQIAFEKHQFLDLFNRAKISDRLQIAQKNTSLWPL